jgi:tetratricopeptide (TPR) repeat protein
MGPFLRARRLLRWPWLAGLGMLFVLGVAAWWGSCYLWANQALHDAEQAQAHWDFDAAHHHLARAVQLWPYRGETLFLAARAARRAGAYDEAERYLDRARRRLGNSAALRFEHLLLEVQGGRLGDAEKHLLSRAAQNDPESPLILEALALGYVHVYQLNRAGSCLDRLLALQPNHAYAHVWRGRILSGFRDFKAARVDFEQAVALDPEYDEARLELARNLLLRALKPDEALPHLERLRRHQPHNLEIAVDLARSLTALDRAGEAEQLLKEVLDQEPTHAAALAERGRLALEGRRPTEAEEWLRQSLSVEPHAREVIYLLHQSLEAQGKRTEAAVERVRLEQLEADLKLLEEKIAAVGQFPADALARYEVGVICLRNGQDEEGLRWLQGALELDPKHTATHAALAELFERRGNRAEAARHRRLAP